LVSLSDLNPVRIEPATVPAPAIDAFFRKSRRLLFIKWIYKMGKSMDILLQNNIYFSKKNVQKNLISFKNDSVIVQ